MICTFIDFRKYLNSILNITINDAYQKKKNITINDVCCMHVQYQERVILI